MKSARKGIGTLTKRQAEVLRFAAFGYSQEEISKRLGISQPRVSTVLRTANEKVEKAKAVLEFYEELKYLAEIKKSGHKGEAVLRS